MWARVVEFMLACWLVISPFIFQHPEEEGALWATDFICGASVALFALLSFAKRLSKIHLLNLLVAFWLIIVGHGMRSIDPLAAHQNQLILGLLFSMLALVPSHSERPPPFLADFSK